MGILATPPIQSKMEQPLEESDKLALSDKIFVKVMILCSELCVYSYREGDGIHWNPTAHR